MSIHSALFAKFCTIRSSVDFRVTSLKRILVIDCINFLTLDQFRWFFNLSF